MTESFLHSRRRRSWIALGQLAGAAWLGLLAAGCGMTLEDGYKPRSLDASPEVRRSFYASPFTDQAAAAAKENEGPGGGGGGFRAGRQ
jgi:hypothetical protein